MIESPSPLTMLLSRHTRRREFIGLLSIAATGWPFAVRTRDPKKIPRIGFLGLAPEFSGVEALRAGLRDLGYVEDRSVIIEWRWAEKVDDLPELAAELVRMKVDLIVASSSTFVEAARQATMTIPIVFAVHGDPVGLGHAASLARPSGNATGLSMLLTELATKELEMMKEAVPQARRIGILWNPTTPSHLPALKAIEVASERLGVQVRMVPAQTVEEFDSVFSTMTQDGVNSFLVVASPLIVAHGGALAALAIKYRLPGMYPFKENVEAGGLMSYGADRDDLYRRAATYIDRILKGAKPADLPVEQASKYQLVINLRTAKSLGLTVPPSLLARADEVIE
jgi:putative tryptophan/tyrosine transport system substrate-binding protein